MKKLTKMQKLLAVLVAVLVPGSVIAGSISLTTPSGQQKPLRGDEHGAAYTTLNTRAADGGALPPQQVTPVSPDGGAPAFRESPYISTTEGCMQVECSLVGDAGVVRGVIPVDGGTYYPQAGVRYVAVTTSATGVRVHNQACNSYLSGAGLLLNEGLTLGFYGPKNPDGGVGDLAMHCCSLAASSASAPALFQLCPEP